MKKYKLTFQKEGKLESKIVIASNLCDVDLPKNCVSIEEVHNTMVFFGKIQTLKSEEISNLFFELNLILKAKIQLYDALEIIEEGTKNTFLKQIIAKMKEALKNGKPIYKVLEYYEDKLGHVVISFFKIAEENGNIHECINSLSILLRTIEENKKLIVKNLRYPLVLIVTLLLSMISIFTVVIPQFEFIFEQYNTALPLATVALLKTKYFILNYSFYMVLCMFVLFIYLKLQYKNSVKLRYAIDKFLISKIPYLSEIIFLIYFHRFFLCIKILLDANYKFQNCMINSIILLRNQYLFDRITIIYRQIQSGETISNAFENSSLFNELTLDRKSVV